MKAVDNCEPLVDYSVAMATAYAYELRRGEEILSTGRLLADEELVRGDEVTVGAIAARVEELTWADGELRLVLAPAQLAR
jgi:hypothetical protein